MSYRRYGDGRPPLPSEGHVDDYTLPFLIVAGILCFIGLVLIRTIGGMPGALICAVLAERAIRRR